MKLVSVKKIDFPIWMDLKLSKHLTAASIFISTASTYLYLKGDSVKQNNSSRIDGERDEFILPTTN